ncbi:hypothetical protein [Streptomyces sp. sk226]|uniref:hypothetical protein n=1 Tax=Streptomyces sp. sk226 TaxID=2034268 RepID=UPI00118494DE|nr:hypothetical protein [Streptomyces sp. sk226]
MAQDRSVWTNERGRTRPPPVHRPPRRTAALPGELFLAVRLVAGVRIPGAVLLGAEALVLGVLALEATAQGGGKAAAGGAAQAGGTAAAGGR